MPLRSASRQARPNRASEAQSAVDASSQPLDHLQVTEDAPVGLAVSMNASISYVIAGTGWSFSCATQIRQRPG